MNCSRIRVGGTITGSTLSGGTVIESQAIGLESWDGLYGIPGFKGTDWAQYGQSGMAYRARKKSQPRYLTLTVNAWDRDAAGTITAPGGRCEELADNIDTLTGLFYADGEQFILERDQPDGTTRWIKAQLSSPAIAIRGPLFGSLHSSYAFTLPLVCAYPWWQAEVESSTTLSGADSLVQNGNAPIENAVLVFAGDGTLTADGSTVTVLGSGGAVTINVGTQVVTEGGSPADNWASWTNPDILIFGPGTTTTSGTASVGVTYRDSWVT